MDEFIYKLISIFIGKDRLERLECAIVGGDED